jgi:hypothetical protein
MWYLDLSPTFIFEVKIIRVSSEPYHESMKGQVVPVTYGGSRYVAVLILNLGTRLTPQEGIPVPGLSPRGGLDSFGEDKISFPYRGSNPGPPVPIKSYVLHMPSSRHWMEICCKRDTHALHCHVYADRSGSHLTSCSWGAWCSFSGVNAAWPWSWLLISMRRGR